MGHVQAAGVRRMKGSGPQPTPVPIPILAAAVQKVQGQTAKGGLYPIRGTAEDSGRFMGNVVGSTDTNNPLERGGDEDLRWVALRLREMGWLQGLQWELKSWH